MWQNSGREIYGRIAASGKQIRKSVGIESARTVQHFHDSPPLGAANTAHRVHLIELGMKMPNATSPAFNALLALSR
jgi:hypothetical protein